MEFDVPKKPPMELKQPVKRRTIIATPKKVIPPKT